MDKSSRLVTHPPYKPKNQADNQIINSKLNTLEKKFDEFHQTHPPQTKIPDSLRRAVLTALQNGIAEQEIRQACGITSSQIRQWQKSCGKSKAIEANKLQKPRILEVHDDTQIQNAKPDEIAPAQTHPMEIRLGGWSISISQINQLK